MRTDITPFKSAGDFHFGTTIYDYTSHDFSYSEEDEDTGWSRYTLESEGIDIYVENGLIISISCEKSCYLNDFNLIGENISVFCSREGLTLKDRETDKIYVSEEEGYQDAFEFDELGLQIWCKDQIIKAVICDPEIED